MNRFSLLILAAIFLAVAWRSYALTLAPDHPQDLTAVRNAVVDWIERVETRELSEPIVIPESLRTLGVTNIRWQRFDLQALVMMRPGADGKPGIADIDDNGNGIVDDEAELGATGSDDVCVVATDDDRDNRLRDDGKEDDVATSPTLVLQRGARVPSIAARATSAVVLGQTRDCQQWTFWVEFADQAM